MIRKAGLSLGLLTISLCGLVGSSSVAAKEEGSARLPRLVVVVSIDQFRADYLNRFADLYLPARTRGAVGGFRYLMERGARYPDCRYDHHRTVTAAGHAIIGTGAQPAVNGIVGNSWWNRATRKSEYCVQDAKSRVVGAMPGSAETPMSPANLTATTVGDELELATGGAARTVSISLKDRAAILMAGHRADTVVWFDETTGGWVSSSYYVPTARLPEWVNAVNEQKIPDRLRARPWTPQVSAEAMKRVWNPKGSDLSFSHALSGKDYGAFATSPAGTEFVLETARKAVAAEKLGQDEIPDILTLNFASNDYVGHRYGPDSPETLDISVQTDRQLSEFLNFLEKSVPGGLKNVTFAVSADHGVATVPELSSASGVPVARAVGGAIKAAAESALDAQVGAADWIAGTDNGDLYFAEAAVAAFPKVSRSRMEEIASAAVMQVAGVQFACGRSAVFSGRVPHSRLGRQITHGTHPDRTGDVTIILKPLWIPGSAPTGTGTTHGAPYPYDAQVPMLVAGFGMRPGAYTERTQPAQLAPTLALILGVARPSAAEEPLLPGVIAP
ncbi:MAG: alkaline phosphatase family protein [Actinomycetota bacterium]